MKFNKFDIYYRNIYLCQKGIARSLDLEEIAKENDTSFNNVVISMIEECLKKNK
jgi:hypothetical protein